MYVLSTGHFIPPFSPLNLGLHQVEETVRAWARVSVIGFARGRLSIKGTVILTASDPSDFSQQKTNEEQCLNQGGGGGGRSYVQEANSSPIEPVSSPVQRVKCSLLEHCNAWKDGVFFRPQWNTDTPLGVDVFQDPSTPFQQGPRPRP